MFEGLNTPEYSNFIALSRYARWLPTEGRRETWGETVTRYIDYFRQRHSDQIPSETFDELYNAIYNLEVMPSMRCLMTAGEALDRDNVAGFNCAYLIMNRQRAFDEVMYILMCGTGVGFSCERDEVSKLPSISEEMHHTDTTIVVSDSKIGWASAFRELISLLYTGKIPKWDVSRVRPPGSALKTFGGRASGPDPLVDLFNYSVDLFRNALGRQLTSLEVHGLVCKTAEVVVVGGVRRSALISLSSYSDDRLRGAKSGAWFLNHPEYSLANNSIAYSRKPDSRAFMREWMALEESESGERGIFNREASQAQAGKNGRRDGSFKFGTNPCSEIILRDRQFCNLSEVIVRNGDSLGDLKRKVWLATVLGKMQSTLTNFRYLSKAWEDNTKEEGLLGISLTGIMDHPILSGNTDLYAASWKMSLPKALEELKEVSIEIDSRYSEMLGIPVSAALTCVKPSGTVSQLVDSSSGIHTRHAPFYIRTVRGDNKDPLVMFMKDQGFPWEPDVSKPDQTSVFSFPIKSPEGSVCRNDRSAIDQLEHWLIYQRHWCEHKPSVTVSVKEDEWMEVGAWVYRHFDEMSGVSFLPYDGGTYRQAPYQECSEEEYQNFLSAMPQGVDWSGLSKYETEDKTAGGQTFACAAGVCEVVDL